MVRGPRSFVEEESFAEARNHISSDVRRMDEVMAGVLVLLCTKPELGTPVPGTADFFAIRTQGFPGAPELGVLYRYDDEHVHGYWIALY